MSAPPLRLRVMMWHAAIAVAAFSLPLAQAQNYPDRPVRWIVGAAPGGGSDLLARAVAAKLGPALGQQVVVDNRAGAGTVVGTEIAAKSAPDGYTLFFMTATHTIKQSLEPNLPYDLTKDFAPITRMTTQPNVLLVPATSPARSVKDFIAYAKSKNGLLNYATTGVGTSSHLAMELFKYMAKIDIAPVPYKGGAPLLIDLVAGRTDVTFGLFSSSTPHIKSGRLVALAVTSKNRTAIAPELPTIAESGLPGYEVVGWYGAVTRAGTPRRVVERLNAEIIKIMALSEMRERAAQDSADVSTNTPEQFAADIRLDIEKWSKLVKEAGIRVQ